MLKVTEMSTCEFRQVFSTFLPSDAVLRHILHFATKFRKKPSRSERISHAGSPLILLLTQLSLGHYMTNRTMVRSEERINDEVGAHKKRKTRISPFSKPSNESWIIWLHEPATGVCWLHLFWTYNGATWKIFLIVVTKTKSQEFFNHRTALLSDRDFWQSN